MRFYRFWSHAMFVPLFLSWGATWKRHRNLVDDLLQLVMNWGITPIGTNGWFFDPSLLFEPKLNELTNLFVLLVRLVKSIFGLRFVGSLLDFLGSYRTQAEPL